MKLELVRDLFFIDRRELGGHKDILGEPWIHKEHGRGIIVNDTNSRSLWERIGVFHIYYKSFPCGRPSDLDVHHSLTRTFEDVTGSHIDSVILSKLSFFPEEILELTRAVTRGFIGREGLDYPLEIGRLPRLEGMLVSSESSSSFPSLYRGINKPANFISNEFLVLPQGVYLFLAVL